MPDLLAARAEAYTAPSEACGRRFFLRDARDDGALWVCDLPRMGGVLRGPLKALASLGIRCEWDERARLWRLDYTIERYQTMLAPLPMSPPKLPQNEALHDAYALCALLLCHPAPLNDQPMETIRRVLKAGRHGMARVAREVSAQTALRLRQRLAPAHAAGRLLSLWLADEEGG